MRLRPDAWEEIALSAGEEASASVSTILALRDIGRGLSALTASATADLDRLAPGLIPAFVVNLNAWTRSRALDGWASGAGWLSGEIDGDEPPSFGRKAGRNEPCPCGSGRTYGRCCGAH